MSQSDSQIGEPAANGSPEYQAPKLTVFGRVLDLTQGPTSVGTESGNSRRVSGSDRRIKENAVKIGSHDAGFGLYLFDYRPEFQEECGSGRQFGVMADEVRRIFPSAVSTDERGYDRVDYGMIGIVRPN